MGWIINLVLIHLQPPQFDFGFAKWFHLLQLLKASNATVLLSFRLFWVQKE